jgi:DNA-binding CsgD family transcriptional regulator
MSAQGTAAMLSNLGHALHGKGDHQRANDVLHEGLILSRELANKWYTAVALEGLAYLAAVFDHWERAVHLLAGVEAFVSTNGMSLHDHHRAANERYLADIRARLGETAFSAAWESGRTTPFDQVIAEALSPADPCELPNTTPASRGQKEALGLTPREAQVLHLLVQGISDRQIGEALFIGTRTVNYHVTNLLTKLGLNSRSAAAAFAVRRGIA